MRRLFSAREAGGCGAAVSRAHACPGLRNLALAAVVGIACTACAETVTKHGHLFAEGDLKQVTPGMSSEQVRTSLGTPTTTASVGGGTAFYYISSVEGQSMFFAPIEKDRRVVAVYFTQIGAVDRVAQYGLKDGKVFDYLKNETPAHAKDEGIVKALFRNLGVQQFGGG